MLTQGNGPKEYPRQVNAVRGSGNTKLELAPAYFWRKNRERIGKHESQYREFMPMFQPLKYGDLRQSRVNMRKKGWYRFYEWVLKLSLISDNISPKVEWKPGVWPKKIFVILLRLITSLTRYNLSVRYMLLARAASRKLFEPRLSNQVKLPSDKFVQIEHRNERTSSQSLLLDYCTFIELCFIWE